MQFRWNAFNVAKVEKHGLTVAEVEFVVRTCRATAEGRGDDKRYVVGPTPAGTWIRVIFVVDDGIFVIHAMPINAKQARAARRKRRR